LIVKSSLHPKPKIDFCSTVAVPVPKSGEVLVKVMAAAINPVDYKLPLFIVGGSGVGLDCSGVVEGDDRREK
jgi:NADPH:quinone reductase-like Zn-dependent oxidoreductase